MGTTFAPRTSILSSEVNANFLEKKPRTYTTTATAAGTTTLTSSSNQQQFFTGTTTQTVVLPVTSTLALGYGFEIFNNSTGIVTVNSSGANLVQSMAAGSKLEVICILTSGTTAASWQVIYIPNFSTGVETVVSAKVSRNGTQSIPTATTTTVIFNSEYFDTNSAHNTSTGVFTVPTGKGGKYLVSAIVEFAGSAAGARSIDVLTNGTGSCCLDFLFAGSVHAAGDMLKGSTIVSVAEGNTIELQVYQNTGGNLNIGVSGVTYTNMSIARIGT